MIVYHYVGSKEIKDSVANYPIGTVIKSPQYVANWINNLGRETDVFGYVVCTFVIDLAGYLLLADRHSEHIACSGGNPVLSAGEIFFVFEDNTAVCITNRYQNEINCRVGIAHLT